MTDTRAIVKNTGLLYIRMIISMIIGLIAVPIILRSLGEVDYGIYNVVSGVVTMLAFLNHALSSTTQRFLSFELGRNHIDRIRIVFTTSLMVYVLFCVLVILLGETVGLWFVNSKLNIPSNRMAAANWIYQFSIVSFICSILGAPYNAAIISHERMDAYAYISIGEALLKLGAVVCLLHLSCDKLIIYGVFMMALSVLVFVCYALYCRSHFKECRFSLEIDADTVKQISCFAGWGVFGALSNIFKNQGINIILNQFFGVLVNTARGLAFQVDAAVNTLIQNFFLAVKPQIIKTYAEGKTDEMFELVNVSTKVGYYLYFLLSTVLIIDTDYILSLWLGDVPENTVLFTRLVLAGNYLTVMAQPLMMVIHATGKVSLYQFISGLAGILVLPVSYLFLKVYDNVLIPFIVIILHNCLYWFITIERAHSLAGINVKTYLLSCLRMLASSLLVIIPAILLFRAMSVGWMRLIVLLIVVTALLLITIWSFGLNRSERSLVGSFMRNKLWDKNLE